MRTAILIIADDLTGAADSAVAFAERGFPTEVSLHAVPVADCDAEVIAFPTETRDVPAEELPQRFHFLKSLATHEVLLFKKIDSMLRGNTVAEIELASQLLPGHTIIISPAYPRLGRVCIAGQVHWKDAAGEGIIDLAASLRRRGMLPISLAAGQHADTIAESISQERQRGRVFLHDASTEEDLLNLARAGERMDPPVLWVASGGLAHALARQFPPRSNPIEHFAPRSGTALLFVGSDHPITRLQVEMLRQECLTDISVIPLSRDGTAANDIEAAVGGLDPRDISFLFMTGGDTAIQVCRALGVSSLALESEYAPGVPLGRINRGWLSGVPVVLKSGGFGEPALLCRMCHELRATTRSSAG